MTNGYAPAATLLAALAMLVGCRSSTNSAETDDGVVSFRDCVTVAPDLEEWIELHTNGSVSAGEAVKSRTHRSIYFISAHFNLDDVDDVGTWAMTDLRPGSQTWAIDANAQHATDFDHGDEADEALSMKDDAARVSRACVPG
jgi:hypothetical protein